MYDSGIGQDSRATPQSSPVSRKEIGNAAKYAMRNVAMNGFNSDQNGRFIDNDPKYEMDPLEYEFLQQRVGSDDNDENGPLMDSLAITSNSLSGSRNSLVCCSFSSNVINRWGFLLLTCGFAFIIFYLFHCYAQKLNLYIYIYIYIYTVYIYIQYYNFFFQTFISTIYQLITIMHLTI